MIFPLRGRRAFCAHCHSIPDPELLSAKEATKAAIVAAFVLVLFTCAKAQSPTEPIINRFGQVGLEYTESAKTLGMGRLVFSAFGDASLDNSMVQLVNLDATHLPVLNPQGSPYDIMPSIGFGILNFLDISATLPLYVDNMSRYDSLPPPPDKSYGGIQGGLGDMELKLKLQVPPRKGPRVLDMAYLASVSFPTGDKTHGYFPRHAYYLLKDSTAVTPSGDSAQALSSCYSSGITEVELKLLFTFNCWEHDDVIPLLLHVNLGARILAARGFDQVLLFNAAAEYRPASWISLYTEASAEPRLGSITDGFKIGNDPLRLSPGITIHMPEGLFVSLGADWGLSSQAPITYKAENAFTIARLQPNWKLNASIGWCGFLFKVEPAQKVRKNLDSDNDGIPDSIDKCPQVPEDFDGFEDEDGCPDYDNDKDGIADSLDECPNDPEDYDGYQDKDGCPDPDNDKDGICDPWVADQHREKQYEKLCKGSDKCPNLPEDMDNFEDEDGCPDYDNDLDGVPDSLDRCPDVPGPADNFGCPKDVVQESPKAKEIKRGRLILKGIDFKPNSADLVSESYQKLDDVFESLKAYPEVKIEICGFTDNFGNAAVNRKLSLHRAETVRAYLILRGVDASRIKAIGRGGEDPITNNTTPEGRAFNRRIEMRRID
jgi:outer membrane protein OmpA-like peptidoglycan-associated protein